MLDPTIGKWLSEDPVGFQAADPNLYRYVGNNPTNKTDPTGLYEEDVHFYMTYYLGLAVGLGKYESPYHWGRNDSGGLHYMSEAYVIAWACAFTDVHSWTEPFLIRLPVQTATVGCAFGGFGFLWGLSAGNDEAARVRQAFHFPLNRGERSVKRNSAVLD